MAKGDFYFPLFYKRLLTSTIGWTDSEFGAYLRLLIYQFDNGYIPSDINELARIAPSVKKHWKLISKKFRDDGHGNLINEVMNETYHSIQTKKINNKEYGKLGGRPKKNRTVIELETETKPDGFKNETETKPIPIVNNKYQIDKEREAPPVFFTIEHCLTVAMNDSRWVKANKATVTDLKEFNAMLERRGVYEKNPYDYKTHYANWKSSGKKDELPDKISAVKTEIEDDNLRKLKELHGK